MRERSLRLVVALALLALALAREVPAAPSGPAGTPTGTGGQAAAAPRPGRASGPLPVFATARGIELRLVSPQPLLVAFHEGGRGSSILHPQGACVVCSNRRKYRPQHAGAGSGLLYAVMRSRGRPNAATSAVDVALRPDDPVLSPVHGVVIAANRYRLYGRFRDRVVTIRPHGSRRWHVALLHLRNVPVRPGDRVVAGRTVLGYARPFPFRSQVDSYVWGFGRFPHVHIEVRRG